MPLLFAVLLVLWLIPKAHSQVNFAEHIAPIIYTHCTSCHRPGEIGTMPFTNYQEIRAYGTAIAYVTGIRYMPPWKPNHNYSNFLGENVLSDQEIQQIADWVTAGMPRGDSLIEPTPPQYSQGSQLGTPDLVLSFSQSYTHVGSDDYRIFVLPTGLSQERAVAAVELRPGNASIVHHALFSWDTSGTARQRDAQTPEYGYTQFGAFGIATADINQFPTYTPGQKPRRFPNGTAQRLPANSDFLIQMHYGPTSQAQTDSSTINIFFAQPPVTRYVQQYVLLPNSLTNGPFVIQPNQVKTFHGQFTVPFDVSLISIFPHMHLLGKSWLVYAVRPNGDTVRLIDIPNWNFNWQGFYNFPRFIKLERNTVLHAYATYDNTTNNPFNPSNPPQTSRWGENTTDEMFYLAFMYVPYANGDENIVFPQDTVVLGPPRLPSSLSHWQLPDNKLYPPYPNPSKGTLTLGFVTTDYEPLSLEIIDIRGQVVQQPLLDQPYLPGQHQLQLQLPDLPNGLYALRLRGRNWERVQKLSLLR
jgi:hypothetical protein